MEQQIPFEFFCHAPTFDNFMPGSNVEVLTRLRSLDFPRVLYLWGAAACGKTHLLDATRALHAERVVIADDAQSLDAAAQEALFDAFNRAIEQPHLSVKLVVAGDRAPLQLALREDLRTRLGAGLVFEVHPLSDEEKRVALSRAARERGVFLNEEFVDYLLTHFRRDMRNLVGLLDALDRFSLASKRPITLPLLRELLQRDLLETTRHTA